MKFLKIFLCTSLLCLPFALRSNADEIIFPAGFSRAPVQPEGWTLLPSSRPFMPLPPDLRDLHTALHKNSHQEIEADVGAYRSIAGWRGNIAGEDSVTHFGIEGNGYFRMREVGSRFPLQSSDGLFGLYAETIRGLNMLQLRYTHISAHLSDGLYMQRTPIQYTREYALLRFAHQFGWTRGYVGYQLLTHTSPEFPKSSGDFGFYSVAPMHWGPAHPFLGADLRLRDKAEGTDLNITTGAALISTLDPNAPVVRISANYLTGHDMRGQFYMQSVHEFSAGIDLDL